MSQTPHPLPITTVIEPTQGWRFLDWRELWAYRDLLSLLVWRDLASRYKQTALGPLWFIAQPLLTALMFTFVFGKVAEIPTGGVPHTLFYLCGLLTWNYFAQTFQSTSTTLVNNAGLFGKVYFPRLIVPLSAVVSNLATFAIQLALFAGFFVAGKFGSDAAHFHLEPSALLLPLVVAQVGLFSLGVGLWLAALTAKFRDFGILAGFAIQLWLYATPVIYPLSKIPDGWQWLAELNPMAMPVELSRAMLLGTPMPAVEPVIESLALALATVTVTVGVFFFRRAEKSFVDVV